MRACMESYAGCCACRRCCKGREQLLCQGFSQRTSLYFWKLENRRASNSAYTEWNRITPGQYGRG